MLGEVMWTTDTPRPAMLVGMNCSSPPLICQSAGLPWVGSIVQLKPVGRTSLKSMPLAVPRPVLRSVTVKPIVAAAVPAIAVGGGAVMALAYAILMPLMPEDGRGALTGYYSVSRGVGIVLGPVLAGAVVSLTAGGMFEGTHGFQGVWIVPCAATLASLPLLRRLRHEDTDRKELRAS